MRIAIRVDASLQIGSGHVMRCLTLSLELKAKGNEILFICRDLPGNCVNIIRSTGFEVALLGMPEIRLQAGVSSNCKHADWLQVSWLQDAEETAKVININEKYDWLIIDHYALDKSWEHMQRPFVKHIAVIDDLADRIHDCDLLLDQNLYKNMDIRYENLVPVNCKQLLGPKYALLRKEFREARSCLRFRDGSIKRILVFFGGVDQFNMTLLALNVLESLKYTDIGVDVVIGQGNPHKEIIKTKCNSMQNVNIHVQVEYMSRLMCQADLAIGAGGTTNWERLMLGLPAVLIAIAFNQEKSLIEMDRLGLCKYIGVADEVDGDILGDAIQVMLENPKNVKQMSEASLKLMEFNSFSLSEYIVGWNDAKS